MILENRHGNRGLLSVASLIPLATPQRRKKGHPATPAAEVQSYSEMATDDAATIFGAFRAIKDLILLNTWMAIPIGEWRTKAIFLT